jgi:hypothetical protein
MAFPSFVNAGTLVQSLAVAIPPLPVARVNGGLLVAWCRVASGFSNTISVLPVDWSPFASIGQGDPGNLAMRLAYRYIDGTETAPRFSITNANNLTAQVLQYTGVVGPPQATGAVSANNIDDGAHVSCTGVQTTAAQSLAVFMVQANTAAAPPTPAGWNLETSNSSFGFQASDLQVGTSGGQSGSVSVSFATANYSAFIFELLSQVPAKALYGVVGFAASEW